MDLVEDQELLAHVLAILDDPPTRPAAATDTPVQGANGEPRNVCSVAGEEPGVADRVPVCSGTESSIAVAESMPPTPPPAAWLGLPDVRKDISGAVVVKKSTERAKEKRKHDPNKARNQRKREIDALRIEADELSRVRSALQTVSTRDYHTTSRIESEHHAQPVTGASRVWESICRHQLERRIRTERENARLRRALDEQLKIANSLQHLVQKPSRVLDASLLRLPPTKRLYSLPADSEADAARFTELLAEVDASRHEIDGVFRMNGLSFSSKPYRGAQMRNGERGRFVDLISSDLLPFSLGAVADVIWQFYSGSKKHRGPLYYKTKLESPSDTVVEKFAIELFAKDVRADFRVWQVLRRIEEADCMKVVWMGIIEPVEFSNQSFTSCGFREKGYIACKRTDVTTTSLPPGYTHLLRCHRVVPYTTHAADAVLTEDDKREIGTVIEFMLSLDSISAHLESFEDMLMRRSVHDSNDL